MSITKTCSVICAIVFMSCIAGPYVYGQDDDNTRNVLKQGLLGAGVGAIGRVR